MEWQPIATAPKDGTEIVVFHREAGVCAAYCPGEGYAWHTMDGSNTVPVKDAHGNDTGLTRPRLTSFVEDPTHWMPLPPPPTIPAQVEEEK